MDSLPEKALRKNRDGIIFLMISVGSSRITPRSDKGLPRR